MRGIGHKSLQAAVGQLELIGKGSLFTLWAHVNTLFGSCKAHAMVSCAGLLFT
jgi:hypothetical protein